MIETYDVVVVGGGPAGATAAHELATRGRSVLLLDRGGRIKPCGGAIPPRLIRDFAIPDHLLAARVTCARMVAPSARAVDMPIDNGFVGMVDRAIFDDWLRDRAAAAGATRCTGQFHTLTRDADGIALVHFRRKGSARSAVAVERVRARVVIGADGAKSSVAMQCIKGADRTPHVFAYHEIVRSPAPGYRESLANPDTLESREAPAALFDGTRCDVYYQGRVSPDFYGWVFPHGDTASVGSGSARKGFSLRQSVNTLRQSAGLADAETLRREGAPIPLRPLRRWDNGRDVIVAGDAAGAVAPASGEGIYYAMECGRLAALSADAFVATGDVRALRSARRQFMRAHGRVFWILGMMQWFWYSNDKRREQFVSICRDPDVQRLTWDSYMNKRLKRADPMAHICIFFKDLGHLLGVVST